MITGRALCGFWQPCEAQQSPCLGLGGKGFGGGVGCLGQGGVSWAHGEADGFCDGLAGGGHDVAVAVYGGGDGFVAEMVLHHVGWGASIEQPAGVGVAGIVNAGPFT